VGTERVSLAKLVEQRQEQVLICAIENQI